MKIMISLLRNREIARSSYWDTFGYLHDTGAPMVSQWATTIMDSLHSAEILYQEDRNGSYDPPPCRDDG